MLSSETGLFGIALTTLLEWDQKRQAETSIRVPLVLQEIITFVEKNGLNDEGILRVPGSALRIKNLKQVQIRISYASSYVDAICNRLFLKQISQQFYKSILVVLSYSREIRTKS